MISMLKATSKNRWLLAGVALSLPLIASRNNQSSNCGKEEVDFQNFLIEAQNINAVNCAPSKIELLKKRYDSARIACNSAVKKLGNCESGSTSTKMSKVNHQMVVTSGYKECARNFWLRRLDALSDATKMGDHLNELFGESLSAEQKANIVASIAKFSHAQGEDRR